MPPVDVTRAARLARIELGESRLAELSPTLDGALAALEPLRRARLDVTDVAVSVGAGGMPLRADAGPAFDSTRTAAELAASAHGGYVLVPRLATPPGAVASPDAALGAGAGMGAGVGAGLPDVIGDDALAAELDLGA